MVVMTGKFDGTRIVLDAPVPDGISPDTPVRVIFEDGSASALDKIARLARDGGLPRDYARQHEHYVKGTPKR